MQSLKVFLLVLAVSAINCQIKPKTEMLSSAPYGKNVLVARDTYNSDTLFMSTPWSTKWEMCPKGMRAIGFVQKNEPYKGPYKDDTSVNGIGLICGLMDGNIDDESIKITSEVGNYGEWGGANKCKKFAYLSSFRLSFDATKAYSISPPDKIGVDQILFKCTGIPAYPVEHELQDGYPQTRRRLISGFRETWGAWSETCKEGICGINTHVDGGWKTVGMVDDKVGLVNVRFSCC